MTHQRPSVNEYLNPERICREKTIIIHNFFDAMWHPFPFINVYLHPTHIYMSKSCTLSQFLKYIYIL